MKCLDCQFGTPVLDEGATGALKGIRAWCSIYEEHRKEPCAKFIVPEEFQAMLHLAVTTFDSLPHRWDGVMDWMSPNKKGKEDPDGRS